MDPVEAEALRRRLSAPDATEEDRRRYAVVAPDAPDLRPAPTHRRRVPVGMVVVAAILVAAGGAALTGRPARPDVADTPRAIATAAPTAAPTQPVISGPAVRVPVQIDGVAAVGQRLRGEGQAVVPIDTSSASFRGGSVAVVLSSADGRPMGWEVRGLVTRQDWSSYQQVIGRSAGADRRGIPAAVTTPYTGAPPLWIAVQAPAGASWTLTVALTGPKG
ncbi:hypothetical protein [uncultured Amnibacterium sp.]|uniref:hypothetical protein n=1 Tax=uncultured Amnibacterium sp. TaxID=1631851 RepID=UPI0035CBEAC3